MNKSIARKGSEAQLPRKNTAANLKKDVEQTKSTQAKPNEKERARANSKMGGEAPNVSSTAFICIKK